MRQSSYRKPPKCSAQSVESPSQTYCILSRRTYPSPRSLFTLTASLTLLFSVKTLRSSGAICVAFCAETTKKKQETWADGIFAPYSFSFAGKLRRQRRPRQRERRRRRTPYLQRRRRTPPGGRIPRMPNRRSRRRVPRHEVSTSLSSTVTTASRSRPSTRPVSTMRSTPCP